MLVTLEDKVLRTEQSMYALLQCSLVGKSGGHIQFGGGRLESMNVA